jgi:glycosyltransferase involved in cell wall biosynthesis
MNANPDVSVIIAMYNSEAWIEKAIQSVLQQIPHGLQLEIVVIDDGSTDKSVAIVKEIRDDKIKLVSLPKNMGQAHARNKGLELAAGAWIQFLDSDDRIGSDLYGKFEKAIQPGINCYLFSLIRELPHQTVQQTIQSIKDKRAFGHYGGTVCNKFIRREICIQFNPLVYADICFCVDMMVEKDLHMGFVKDAYYFYNKKNDSSVTAHFNKSEFNKMIEHLFQQLPKSDIPTKKFILEICVAFLFDRKIPLSTSFPVAVKSLLKLHRHLLPTILHQNRKSIENKVI